MLRNMIQDEVMEIREEIVKGFCKKQNFTPLATYKIRKKTGMFCGHRKKIYWPLGLSGTRNSCALGVPPVRTPKKSYSRGRKQHAENLIKVNLSQSFESFFYKKCVEQKKTRPTITSSEILCLPSQLFVPPVQEDDQYDFLNCTMLRNEEKELVPFGQIPQSDRIGFLPCRLAHTLTYLFRRGYFFQRRGPSFFPSV